MRYIKLLLPVLLVALLPATGWAAVDLSGWEPAEELILGQVDVTFADLPADLAESSATGLAVLARELTEQSTALLPAGDVEPGYWQAARAVVIGRALDNPDLIAPALYQAATALATINDLVRATQYADALAAEMEEYGLRRWWGDAHWLAGYCRLYLGQYKESLDDHEKALTVYREEGDSWNTGLTLGNIGALYSYRGEYERALDCFEQSERISADAGDTASAANALNNIGAMYANLGRYDDALDYYAQALADFQELGDAWSEGSTYDNMALLYRQRGNFAAAAEYYQHVIDKRLEVGDTRAAGAAYNNLGLVQADQGLYNLALENYATSLELVQAAGDLTSYGSALNNIGVIYETLGLHSQALAQYLACLEIRRAENDRGGECEALNNVGLSYYNQDQYDQALDYLEQSGALADEFGDPKLQAWALNNTGLVYDARHQYAEAQEYYEQARQLKLTIPDPVSAAISGNNAAMASFSQGYYDAALAGVEEALAAWETGGDRRSILIGLNNRSAILLQLDRPGEALASSRQALALAREQVRQFTWESGLKQGLADDLRFTGILQLMAQLAQDAPDDAFATLESIKGVPLLQLLLQAQSQTQDDEARAALGRYRTAQALSQTARGQLAALATPADLVLIATDATGAVDEEQLAALIAQEDNKRAHCEADLAAQAAIAADAWDYLREHDPRLTEIIEVQGLTPQAVQQHILKPNQVALEYLVVAEMSTYALPPEVVVFCLPATGQLTVARRRFTMIPPEGTADDWIALQVDRLLGTDAAASQAAGRELYEMLIAPVADAIPPDNELLICPDRQLYAVPFEALTTPEGAYLLDGHAISYATSATMLDYIPETAAVGQGALVAGLSFGAAAAEAEQDAALDQLLAMRGADSLRGGLFRRDTLFPLPGVPAEVHDVAEILQADEALDGMVTEGWLAAEMPGHAVVHLATHGFIHSTPLMNGIVTWLGEADTAPAEAGDGFMTMGEIMGLPLAGCELVALSCCHSAEGEIAPGQGVMGLSQGFLYAGAQTVLASLDKVDDAATRELMAAFYRNWREAGLSKSAALRQAKQQISAEADWRLPRYWAPFVLYGK
ncbi:CHAT domain-containing protein [bacterium]|nr:CHAT domain-containing protein [bacterium]